MNNISTSSSKFILTSLTTNTTNLVNKNYLSKNTIVVNKNTNHNLSDRNLYIETNYNCYITNIPKELHYEIFAKLDIKDLCSISLVSKNFFSLAKDHIDKFHIAHELFLEYSTVSQRKIKLIFNKNNYHKHLKSWLKNFSNIEHTLSYLDNIQNIDTFYKILFFCITKTIQLSTSIKVVTKFTSTYNDIAVSVGYSSDNTNLFIAYLNGLIKIYQLDKNKKLSIQNEINLQQQIDFAKFSPNGHIIVVTDINNRMTIISVTKKNKWKIENNNLQVTSEKYIIFSSNSKYLLAINRDTTCFYQLVNSTNRLNNSYTTNYPNMLTTAVFSFDNKYYAIGENSGNVSIILSECFNYQRSTIYLNKHSAPIAHIKFSINNEYLATTAINNTTNIYKLNSNQQYETIFFVQQDDMLFSNTSANACFSNDSNTVIINHGTNIIILGNLNSVKNITKINCELNSNLGKACISNNNKYIIIYAQLESIIKLYRKNNLNEWHNVINIDTKVSIKLVKFSTKEHHFAVISSKKTIVYNLCDCKKNMTNDGKEHILANRSKINILANKKLQYFTIDTPKISKKHIIFNPYFCQLLVAYNNIIKIFIPSDTYKWDNKLTLTIDMPIIETVQYTNDGSHILVNSTNDNESDIKLLAIN